MISLKALLMAPDNGILFSYIQLKLLNGIILYETKSDNINKLYF
jgi:hypothetical protein